MNFVFCWKFHEQNKAIKPPKFSEKKNGTMFRDKGMVL